MTEPKTTEEIQAWNAGWVRRRATPKAICAGDYFLIELTGGRYAKVCRCHLHLIDKKCWMVNGSGYAVHNVPRKNGKRITAIQMHREILGLERESKFKGDHINGDRLDNRCINLRVVNDFQNAKNAAVRRNSKSGFKGVHRSRGRWVAKITSDKLHFHIGSFDTPEEAAIAYNKKAYELHGEFARLNEIPNK